MWICVALFAALATACTDLCNPVPPMDEECLQDTNLGQQLCIVNGDITQLPTYDALVNPANSMLQNGAGAAARFVQCGGQGVQTDCSAVVAKNGPISTSQNAVTDAGCLPNRDLISCVGPVWDATQPEESERLLTETMYNILRTARMLCDETVAVPLVSAGIFGFGGKRSSEILTKAALDFYLYMYETPKGQYSQDTINQAVGTTRFKPPRTCDKTKLYPSKVTIVGWVGAEYDMVNLRNAMKRRQAEINELRKQHPTGTFTETMPATHTTTAPPTTTSSSTDAPTPMPTTPPAPCGAMSCGGLAFLIIVIILALCVAGAFAYRQIKLKKESYQELS